ncbi:hypothetical protein BGZ74_001792 [Mortierella antarctica]|nr:hypothetical protein BGZ74_001792 [Mortierella antarctica]
MDTLTSADLDEATFVLTRPFDLQSSTAPTTNGFPELGLHHPSLQAPFDALRASAIPSSLPLLMYNPAQPLLEPSGTSLSTCAALCPWSHSTSPTPSLSPLPFHLTPSFSQPHPTLSTESLSSTSQTSSRSHSPFSTTEEDSQSRLWSSWTPVLSYDTKSSSSLSSLSSSPMSQSSSSSSSSTSSASSSSLTCSFCLKKYANNSTLRRHQKIHVYAKNEARPPTSRLPPHLPPLSCSSTPFATTPTSTSSSTSSSTSFTPLLGRLVHPTNATGVSTTERRPQGYSPGSDPDIKKPECVGCGKAFARRDTVILHIKNQKRHWDEFVAMREQWIQEKASTSSSSSSSSGMLQSAKLPLGLSMPMDVSSGTNEAAKKGGRGSRPRKAADRYRRAEKLWHSTQQGRIYRRLRKNSSHPSLRTRCRSRSVKDALEERDDIFEFELDDVEAISAEDEWEEEEDEEDDDDEEAVEEGGQEGDTGMYGVELVANMNAPQKFEWIMRAMRMPPCWKERRVRLFGAFGVLEESVLQ